MKAPLLYRKKPVVIEAIKFEYSRDGIEALQKFCGSALISFNKDRHIKAIGWARIGTLEDGSEETCQVNHVANEGDWIVKGVHGEFYPVKSEIFEATYEEA